MEEAVLQAREEISAMMKDRMPTKRERQEFETDAEIMVGRVSDAFLSTLPHPSLPLPDPISSLSLTSGWSW